MEALAFERAISSGRISSNVSDRVQLSPMFSGAAFTPEVMELIYGGDAAWAGAATLVDGRNPGRCGGGGCNAPSCAWQYWNIGLPCNEQNLQAYMFQLPRYVWAQQRLRQLWTNPPDRFNGLTNGQIANNQYAWNVWLTEVYRAMGLLRWASNMRWELVSSKISLPFEWGVEASWLQRKDSAWAPQGGDLRGPRDGLLLRYMAEAERFFDGRPPYAVGSMLMESSLTWAYHQAGRGYHPDSPISRHGDPGGDLRPLAWPLRVPTKTTDFDPVYGAWMESVTPTAPAMPIPPGRYAGAYDGRRMAYEYQIDIHGWQNMVPAFGAGGPTALGGFLAAGRTIQPQALAMKRSITGARSWFSEWTSGRGALPDDMLTVPTPLMQVLIASERAQAYMELDFGVAVSAGLSAWAEMMLALPEELRGVDAQALEALQANMLQAQLSEAAAYVGAGFGAAAGIVTAVVPQPYGAIIGAVIAIIGAIVTALMGAAYSLGLARPDRPTCPAPPLLRMIEDPETGACDFDAARRGVEEVVGKSNVIVALIGEGIYQPDAWLPALEALAARPMDASPPVLPPPDVQPETSTFKYVAGGLAVGALALGLARLLRS